MTISIEALNTSHSVLLEQFQNQHTGLKDYIRNFALTDVQTHLCETYLAVDQQPNHALLAGYFCITTATIDTTSEQSSGFPIPAMYLMRLAVDQRIQGQGLGTYLLKQAIKYSLSACPTAYLIVADAERANVIKFYQKNGFKALSNVPGRMALIIRPRNG